MQSSALVLSAIFVCALASANGQQCDGEFAAFHQCLADSHQKAGGQKPNFEEMKAKADQCFTSNGCDAPKPPPDADNRRRCHEAIEPKVKDYVLQCMRKQDPSFTTPPPIGGPGMKGPGGHGGPGGPMGHGGPGHDQQMLLELCKSNAESARKVNSCLAGVFQEKQRPSTDDMRKKFEEHCKAKAACDAKLTSACKAEMERRGKAMCQCENEVKPKIQEYKQQESTCSAFTRDMMGPPGERQRDCNKKPEDMCAKGFDAFMQEMQNRGGGPHGLLL